MKDVTKIEKMNKFKNEIEKRYVGLASDYMEIYRWYYGEGKSMREIAEKLQLRGRSRPWTKSTIDRIIKAMDEFLNNPYTPKQCYWEMGLTKDISSIDRFEWWTDFWMDREAVGRTLALALFVWNNTQQYEIWKIEMEQIYKDYKNLTKRKQLIEDLQKLKVASSQEELFPSIKVFKSLTERRGKIYFEFNEKALEVLLGDCWNRDVLTELGIDVKSGVDATFDFEAILREEAK